MPNIKIHRLEYSPLEFKSFKFPGGEPHTQIDPKDIVGLEVWVEAHIGSMGDFGDLLVTLDAIRRCRPRALGLFIPYFPGARQDHPEPGTALTVGVYADALKPYLLDTILVADPHSPVTQALTGCETILQLPIRHSGKFLREHTLTDIRKRLHGGAK